ncbi:MAG TPA: hypothetical protein VHA56_06380 [Mucilaginibacter sp.]|nr:hypothetical protein [Mucilaginibacter sp.]
MVFKNNIKTGKALLKIARDIIDNFPDHKSLAETAVPARDFTFSGNASVYIALWSGGKIRGFGGSHNKPLHAAIYDATLLALQEPSGDSLLLPDEIPEIRIGLSVRKSVRQCSDITSIKEEQKTSNSGLSVLNWGRWYDILPDKILRSEMDIETQQQYLLPLARLNEKTVTDEHWYISEWHQFIEPAREECAELYRGRTKEAFTVTKKACMQAALLSAKRLVNQQNIIGQFTYEYLPLDNIINNRKYNLVRMAGTTFGMSMLSEAVKDKAQKKVFEHCAERAMHYLFELAKPARHVENGIYIAEGKSGFESYEGKLGTSALMLLALQFGPYYRKYARERQGLINTLLGLQHPNGHFACYIPPKQRIIDYSCENCQNYFPGEALLALVYELKRRFDPMIAQAVIKAFPFYREFFSNQPNTAFVLWQVSAWALFHQLMEKEHELEALCLASGVTQRDIVAFVYDQTDFILTLQYNKHNTTRPEYHGGFPNTGTPGSVSSCYLEAVIRATHLAARIGDTQKHTFYKDAAIAGLEFMKRLQVKETEAFLFQKPDYAIGGITSNPGAFKLRNDRDQHAITAFIAALETPSLFSKSDLKNAYNYESTDLHLLQEP